MRLPSPTTTALYRTCAPLLALSLAGGCFSEPEGFTSVGLDDDDEDSDTGEPLPGDGDQESSDSGEDETTGDGDETTGDGDETTGDGDPTGDGDGDPTGDGDGDPTGDGDGEPTGDGDGEPTGDGDGEPEPVTQTVFVTSALYKPNEFGGGSNIHAACQTAAETAGLSGTYAAWISTTSYNPAQDFNRPNTPYVLVTGEVVADNWEDLVDGSLYRAIDVNEFGEEELANATANWPLTNTDASGNPIAETSATTCNSYGLLGPSTGKIATGRLTAAGNWSFDVERDCDYLFGYPLYCFEQ